MHSQQKESNDSIIVVNNSMVVIKPYLDCDLKNNKDNVDNDFLNTHIQYFKSSFIDKKSLLKESFYRSFLINTHFLEFEESSFYKGNFTFSVIQKEIKNYGNCYIGKYYFPNADNSAQRKSTVIINIDKNEVSIWDFDNVTVLKDGLKCDINVRGKNTLYKMVYSLKCGRFIKNSQK